MNAYTAAALASRSGDGKALRGHLETALELSDSGYPGSSYMRAATLEWMAIVSLQEDRFDEGLALFDAAVALRGADTQDYRVGVPPIERSRSALFATSAARLLVGAGRLDDAEKLQDRYVRFIRFTGMRASASLRMGKALLDANEPKRSLRHFEAGAKRVPLIPPPESHPDVPMHARALLLLYADALEAAGRLEEADAQRLVVAGASLRSDYLPYIQDAYDGVGFRAWEPSVLPFKLYVSEAPPEWGQGTQILAEIVRGSAEDWADRVRSGVPAFEFVNSRDAADIEIHWVHSRSVDPIWMGHSPPRFSHERKRVLHVQISVVVARPDGPTAIETLRAIVLHELGHAIGLYGHSPNPDDLMYPYLGTGASEISERDVATLRYLYPCTWDSPGVVIRRRIESDFVCDD